MYNSEELCGLATEIKPIASPCSSLFTCRVVSQETFPPRCHWLLIVS